MALTGEYHDTKLLLFFFLPRLDIVRKKEKHTRKKKKGTTVLFMRKLRALLDKSNSAATQHQEKDISMLNFTVDHSVTILELSSLVD
jgi:hypothetical protein